MSNIRPIGDPAIATAMLATTQSIDAARTAPAGISEPRWRILRCIAKAAPNLPSPGELRMCSGLNKAALAEHVQALQWKGLLEMGGYRLSPSAAAMVGIEQPYPPKDTRAMALRGRSGTVIIDEFSTIGASPELPLADIGPLTEAPTIIGIDLASGPEFVAAELDAFGVDGKIAKQIEPVVPLDPADVPACMRPDCTPPAEPIPAPTARLETKKHGRGGAAVAHPIQEDVHRDRVATDRASRSLEEVAGSNPAPGQPTKPTVSTPTATPPKFINWIEERARRLEAAIRFLKSQAILVTVVDRDAQVRQYFVSGKRDRKFAEEVIEIAIEKGWVE